MGKAVCNENCKHGLGRDFSLLLILKEQIIHSIRRAPGSSPGQPGEVESNYDRYLCPLILVLDKIKFLFIFVPIHKERTIAGSPERL